MSEPYLCFIEPHFEDIDRVLRLGGKLHNPPNLIPICATIPADLLTPTAAYLRLSPEFRDEPERAYSFLLESAATSETIGRYSFIGWEPRKVIATGPRHGFEGDPLPKLATELAKSLVVDIPGLALPPFQGGAVGYVGYDCVRYFEPKTSRPLRDALKLPESLFMFFNTIVAFDHFFQTIKIIHHFEAPKSLNDLSVAYQNSLKKVQNIASHLDTTGTKVPPAHQWDKDSRFSSNIGRHGYEAHVTALKKEIVAGNIIQAVPSHRVSRSIHVHPFNLYRRLRTLNPSPYLFYIDCKDFNIIGASPELLVKTDNAVQEGRIITHPIAGTILRGKTLEEDRRFAAELEQSLKDRAEHVMLVDLARNDVNRVCDPLTTKVDRLMVVEKFSHVQHLVSQVSGVLRKQPGEGMNGNGMTRFDAFRSIFPAGTVSGAPKVRAMELIAEREGEKRGVYAGAVGWWGFDKALVGKPIGRSEAGFARKEGNMDTCIALRTMVARQGRVYLQAGGGIVHDSLPADEWQETISKLKANVLCVETAEEIYRNREITPQTESFIERTLLRDLEEAHPSSIDSPPHT